MLAQFLRKNARTMPVKLLMFIGNLWSPFRGAGIKIVKVSDDYRLMEVEMKLKWSNKNYVGTHFGGSMYAMTDPFYMMMLINNLGPEYIVWDKAARIEFKKPGKGTIRVRFEFSEEEILAIKEKADESGKYIFDKPVDIKNESDEIVATVVKTLYVRRRRD
ncbi:MAG: DUF4442 domain-containing protein [Gammaproteobacteria bacterium]|nr:DUF4442 domain-containing protein [Gammaproteobacteria bacterium]